MSPEFTTPVRSSLVGNASLVLAMIAVSASFAGNSVIVKAALSPPNDVDPVVFSFLRDVGGALVLLGACRVKNCLVWPRQEDIGVFVLLGVLGVYVGQQFLVVALQYVTPLNAMLLQPSQPVLTVLLAAVFGMEPLELSTTHGRLKVTGIVLGACGAMYSVYMSSTRHADAHPPPPPAAHPSEEHHGSAMVGNALLLVQCVSGALYQLLQKRTLSSGAGYPPLAVAGMLYLYGAGAVALVLPVCKLDAQFWVISPTGWGALGYAILMTSAFNYGVSAWVNAHSSPAFVTAFFPLQVVFTALFSAVFFGQMPTYSDLIGGLAIIAGLAAVTVGRVLAERKAPSEQVSLLAVSPAEEACDGRAR